eukprot:jgi/Phyca11/104218/e_gw1.9.661.1
MTHDRSQSECSKLRPLRSMQLKPTSVPAHRIATQYFNKVSSIQVSSRRVHRQGYYIVEVFTESTRRDILTSTRSRLSAAESSNIESSGMHDTTIWRRIERELYEFVCLRDKVYNCVRQAHPQQRCSFCLKMADLMVFGSNPDGIWLRLLGGDRAARILTKFVEGVVGQCLSIEAREGCRGQMFAIEAVYEFLFIGTSVT